MIFPNQVKLGFGIEFAPIGGALVFRPSSVTSLVGEPLMCDISNTSYDTDADEGGIFGNGITPTDGAVNTIDYITAPHALVIEAGIATGSRVQVMFQHPNISARLTSGSALARALVHTTTAQRYFLAIGSSLPAGRRVMGSTVAAHGGTGTESVNMHFCGIHGGR